MTKKYHHVFRTYDLELQPGNYEQVTDVSSVVRLPNIPENAVGCLIQVEDQDVRWRADGTDPTASVGMLLKDGFEFWCNVDLARVRLIEVAASAKLNIHYFVTL